MSDGLKIMKKIGLGTGKPKLTMEKLEKIAASQGLEREKGGRRWIKKGSSK